VFSDKLNVEGLFLYGLRQVDFHLVPVAAVVAWRGVTVFAVSHRYNLVVV
jgi:hypothetical protein